MGNGKFQKRTFSKVYVGISLLSILLIFQQASGQSIAILPEQFTHFFATYSLQNAASIGSSNRMEILAGNKSLQGAFSGIRTYYALGHIQINRDSANSKHVVGITFVNDKEGAFIHRSRAAIQYAVHLPVSLKSKISLGLAAGFINYAFSPTNVQAGGSDIAPNLDLGVWWHRERFNAGLAFNQILPSTLTPISETYTVSNFYILNIDKTFLFHRDCMLTPTFLFRYESNIQYNADLAMVARLFNQVKVATGYKYRRGGFISGGLDQIKIGSSSLKLLVSYYTPLGGTLFFNPQSYDLMLSIVP